jgi:hypothetical protein
MSVSRGKIHKYFGMTLDYSVRGQVRISMFEYIDEILKAFAKADPTAKGSKTSAAPEDLLRQMKIVKDYSLTRLWHSITWWPKPCMPPNVQGQTHA